MPRNQKKRVIKSYEDYLSAYRRVTNTEEKEANPTDFGKKLAIESLKSVFK